MQLLTKKGANLNIQVSLGSDTLLYCIMWIIIVFNATPIPKTPGGCVKHKLNRNFINPF